MDTATSGVDINAKIEQFMTTKKYYEAQQLFMTQVNRAISQKNYPTALTLAQQGVRAMLTVADSHVAALDPASVKSSVLAAGELGALYVSALKRTNTPANEETAAEVISLANAIGAVGAAARGHGDAFTSKDEEGPRSALFAVVKTQEGLLRAAQEWAEETAAAAADTSVPLYGLPSIEWARAPLIAELRSPAAAQVHYVRGRRPADHVPSVIAWLRAPPAADTPAWGVADMLRGALYVVALYLEGMDLRGANAVASAATAEWPTEKLGDDALPIRTFTSQLLKVAERESKAAPMFQKLVAAGKKAGVFGDAEALQFNVEDAVTRAGVSLFKIKPQRGMLEELLGISNIQDLFRK